MPTLADLKGQYEELTARRTQNFKVFADGDLTHVSGKIGFMHYRDDPQDIEEPFKDIHADLVSDKFSGVPFLVGEMNRDGYPELTVTHRATGKRVILALADGGSVKSDTAKMDAGTNRSWNDGKFGFESLGEGGIKAWYIIPDKTASHVVRFLLHADEKIEWKGEAHSEEDSGPRLFVAGAIHWTPFWAKDAAGTFLPIHSDYDERTGLMTLTVEPDAKGKTQYPILIDPTAITQEQVGASADDAMQAGTGVTIDDTTVIWTWPGVVYRGGCRWQTVPIPANASINSAVVQVYVTSTSYDDPWCVLDFQNADSAAFTTGANNLSSRTLSGSGVTWQTIGVGTGFKPSPDLSVPLEVVTKGGNWANNDDLALIATGSASSTKYFQVRTWDYTGHTSGALLDCTYTAAATATAKSQVVMM